MQDLHLEEQLPEWLRTVYHYVSQVCVRGNDITNIVCHLILSFDSLGTEEILKRLLLFEPHVVVTSVPLLSWLLPVVVLLMVLPLGVDD